MTIRVVMLERKWAVVRAGQAKPLSVHDRREDAISDAHAVAEAEDVDVVVFDLGGRPMPESGGGGSAK
jgi:hypothetical protein